MQACRTRLSGLASRPSPPPLEGHCSARPLQGRRPVTPARAHGVTGAVRGGSTQQQLRVTHLWWLHEVSHVPQPVPQLLNLGHGDPLELGDDRDLGIRVLLLVAFFGEEGPPGEDRRAAWCVPSPLPRGLLAPSLGLRGPTWSPAPNSLPRPELRPHVRELGPLLGTHGLGDAHHHLLHQPTPSPALSRSGFLLKDAPNPA